MFFRFVRALGLSVGVVFAYTCGAEEASTASGMTNSEFAHQAEASVLEVTPTTGLLIRTYSLKGAGGYKTSAVTLPISATVEYGISPYVSIGGSLGYSSTATSTSCDAGYSCSGTPKSKGLVDPSVDLKARLPIGSGTLRFGTSLSSSLEKSKNDSSGDSNEATGGTTVTPFVVYERVLGPGYIGGGLRYDLYQSDRSAVDNTTDPATSGKTSGGQSLSLSAFYEANVGKLTYGGSLNFRNTTSQNYKVDGNTESTASGFNQYALTYYMPVHFTPTITLLPQATFIAYDYPSGAGVSSGSGVGLSCSGRFAF